MIRSMAAEIAENNPGKAVIIVPEQFSFDTERGMLSVLGNIKINNVEVLSFSRIAEKLISQYGKTDKKTADDGIRAVLMSRAVEALEGEISIYNRYKKYPALIRELLDFHREIKKCSISNQQLAEVSSKVKNTSFSSKLSELSLIFDCYDSLVSDKFIDSSDFLDMLYELLWDVEYFKGKTVFIDAFSGFSAQEYNIIEQILRQADDVYVTFCCDTARNSGRYELFYNTAVEIKKLKSIANKINISVASEKYLESNKKYKKDELNFLEENIFLSDGKIYDKNAAAITVIPCRTKTDECKMVASEIKRLVRNEKLRYRDVAVIVRNEENYRKDLASAFRKYDIDCFHDNRQPVDTQPLIVFMKCLLDILVKGFETETVLRLLKTQLYGFTVEEIALLEDFCLMWKVRSSDWRNEWIQNPEGFGEEFDELSREKLSHINSLRERVAGPLTALRNKIKYSDGATFTKELFAFIRNAGIDKNLQSFAANLLENGENELAAEQGRIWKLLTEILDGLYSALGNSKISAERYSELFNILTASKDIGVIPNGVDEVVIGGADRIRASAPKVVFLMGLNTGVFPGEVTSGVLFNDSQRCELINNGLPIVSNLEYNSVSEMFIAYHAATLSTDKLYLSYSAVDSDSSSLTPSELVNDVLRIFPKCTVRDKFTAVDRIESVKSAFSVMAGESVNGSVLGETLKEYFLSENSENELEKLRKASETEFAISDTGLATEFFGKNMYMTASRVEKFYKCPFSYFCEYGIKAKPRKEAEVDAALSGTLIHYVLEKFLSENPKHEFVKMSENTVEEKLSEIIDEYVKENMGGSENKSSSFARTLDLLRKSACKVVMHLIEEFLHCRFTPADFELKISNDGQIKPYEISLDNGGTVKIVGSVDRVDTYETAENTFVRVIDYKTGGKEFKLGEVFSGLNMQMLIYLFAIWQNGGDYYKNVTPAGVLYFQAKNPRTKSKNITRTTDVKEAEDASLRELRMHGMVLNNIDVVNAMEDGCGGMFIPVDMDKTGALKGNVISIQALSNLKNRVDKIIKNMAEELQRGYISALPIEDGCTWCSYKDICKREESDPIREITVPSFDDAISMLRSDSDGENMD